jgi:hypothetical protein
MAISSFGNESAETRGKEHRGVSAAVSADRGQCLEDPRDRLWADQAVRGRLRLRGIGISPGLAVGTAFIYRDLLQRDVEHPSIELLK